MAYSKGKLELTNNRRGDEEMSEKAKAKSKAKYECTMWRRLLEMDNGDWGLNLEKYEMCSGRLKGKLEEENKESYETVVMEKDEKLKPLFGR